jgi:malonyl-CoA decarboxylase
MLEKIIAYEAVHEIDSWDDLRRRLDPADRRCFAFFHPAMPDEPLIFVEVALTRGIARLDPGAAGRRPRHVLSAKFGRYGGVLFDLELPGGPRQHLLRQLPDQAGGGGPDIGAARPETFVTLSPIPGLMRWLAPKGWPPTPTMPRMRQWAAHYLLAAKRRDGSPLDPVARFHLGNGALVHQVHAGANTAPRGIAESGGTMVNYLYDLRKVAQNHERFATRHEIAASSEVTALAAAAEKIRAKGAA